MINEITKNISILQTIYYLLSIKFKNYYMPKIGFDAKRAAQNRTGLGNYSRFIIDILKKYYPDNEYILYAPSEKKNKLIMENSSNTTIKYPKGLWKKFSAIWRILGITNDIVKDKIDIYHGLSNELPLNIRKAKNTKSIVTIHDLIFLRYPQCYKPIDRWIYNFKFRKACISSDRIIAVSECTKRDIVEFYNIRPEKIEVIYQGCDALFRQKVSEKEKEEAKEKFNLPDRFILYLGSIEERKNLMLLAKAMKHLKTPIKVIAVGKKTGYADKVNVYIKENRLDKSFEMIHGVEFKYLPALYQMAELFVYPSFYEGFGIPILEALCSGTPVIAAKGSCLEEAGGPDSIYISPDNEIELAEKIDLVLNNEQLKTKMIERGYEYAANFNEEKLAAGLENIYSKIRK